MKILVIEPKFIDRGLSKKPDHVISKESRLVGATEKSFAVVLCHQDFSSR